MMDEDSESVHKHDYQNYEKYFYIFSEHVAISEEKRNGLGLQRPLTCLPRSCTKTPKVITIVLVLETN